MSATDLQTIVQRPGRVELKDADPDDAHFAIAQYVDVVVRNALSTVRGSNSLEKQVLIANRVLEALGQGVEDSVGSTNLATPLQRLTALSNVMARGVVQRPDTPLARSALLTGSPSDPALSTQLQKEIGSAEHVDILCSFIKWSGLRLILDQLRELTATPWSEGPRLRVITTSYMGATDPRAVEELSKLPNTQIRVSYDTTRTRLHAKAYVIYRPTGFGSAYIGSANLSRAAMTDGLEWINKISQYELPYLWQRVTATFASYWNEGEFEDY
ncbi:MAG: phospholipase D-like domain-containing protein, partial [Planctomycetota bacterium]|nr:phospholipase D-like domain-containing protein [Planctomycetota bacterium]